MGRSTLSIAVVLAACTVDGSGRGDSGTFGSATLSSASATTGGDTTSGSGDTTGERSTTSGEQASTTDSNSTTSGPIDPTGSGSGGVDPGACPPVDPLDCSAGPGLGRKCDLDGVSCFLSTVQSGVTGVVDGHPEWFDMNAGTPFVLEPESYMNAVVESINGAGLCAIRDPNAGDEVAVKHDNAYAESFDILSAEGNARWGDGIYTATCAPAWF